MRKILAVILAILLLCGCAAAPPAETQSQETDMTTDTKRTEPRVIPAELAKNKTYSYIPEVNADFDIYNDSGIRHLEFFILSEKKLTQNDIKVELPIDTVYRFEFNEAWQGESPQEFTENSGAYVLFSYDIYLHYIGFDWTTLAEKYVAMEAAQELQISENTSENKEKYMQAQNEYTEYYEMYWDDYVLLSETMIPQFNYYQCLFLFEESLLDEQFNTVTVTIDGAPKVIDIGEVRLHSDDANQSSPEKKEFIDKFGYGATTPVSTLYPALEVGLCGFTAKEDISLTGLEIQSDIPELGEIYLQVFSEDGKSNDFIWDRKMPVDIKADSTVEFTTVIKDSRMAEPGFDIRNMIRIEFNVDGFDYQHCYLHQFVHSINPFEEYAKYFDGIDFTEYYEEYYYPIVLGIES